jgi:hypothetical protein
MGDVIALEADWTAFAHRAHPRCYTNLLKRETEGPEERPIQGFYMKLKHIHFARPLRGG